MKPPINPKQVRVLLGHIGYYRNFIRDYSDMTYPLEELLKEDQEFRWTEECQISFDKLKRKLVEAPILKFPNWSIKFHVHIDASGLVIVSYPDSTRRRWNGLPYILQQSKTK